jgi:hypothetical protein
MRSSRRSSLQTQLQGRVQRLAPAREFVLDVAPTARKPTLVTARAQKDGAIDHDEVSVVVASA